LSGLTRLSPTVNSNVKIAPERPRLLCSDCVVATLRVPPGPCARNRAVPAPHWPMAMHGANAVHHTHVDNRHYVQVMYGQCTVYGCRAGHGVNGMRTACLVKPVAVPAKPRPFPWRSHLVAMVALLVERVIQRE